MHKRILSILLALLMAQPVFCCFANEEKRCEENTCNNIEEEVIPLTISNNTGKFTEKKLDIEYLKFMKFELRKDEPIILGGEGGCKFSIDQTKTRDNIYETVNGLIAVECNKDFEVSVFSGTDEVNKLNFKSEDGKAAFLVPLGEVHASFTGTDVAKKCKAAFIGIGKSELEQKGYQFKLEGCNSGNILNPILAGVIAVATSFLSLFNI